MKVNYTLIKSLVLIVLLTSLCGVALATDVGNILQLWNVRNNLSGTFVQTADIDLSVTDPDSLPAWVQGTAYAVGDVVKFTTGNGTGTHPYDNDHAYGCNNAEAAGAYEAANWTEMWEAAKGWEPIGKDGAPFVGNFDGKGKTISNLYINRGTSNENTLYAPGDDGEDHNGLFGYVTNKSNANAEIKNVGLINPRVTGRRGTGSLIGKVMIPKRARYKVIVRNCYAQGDSDSYVRGFGAVGGLVGANNSDRRQQVPVIQFCWTDIDVSSTYPTNTKVNPNDSGNAYNIKYGGIVGCNETGVTFDCYAKGNIIGGDRVGGVAGCAIDGAVIRCYATGNVTQNIVSATVSGAGHVVGAIAGKLPPGLGGFTGKGTVQYCYYPTTEYDGYPKPAVTPVSGETANSLASGIDFETSTNFFGFDPAVWDFATESPYHPTLKGTIGTTLPLYYYYTVATATGNWDGGESVWSRTSNSDYTGGSATKVIPDMFNALGIQVGHEITLNLDISVDNMTITSDGALTINADKTLTVQNGANIGDADDSDLVVEGSIVVNGKLLLGSSATLEVNGTLSRDTNGSIKPGVASNLIDNASSFDYGNIGVDGYSSVSSKYLKFPPTDKLIESFSVSTSASTDMPDYINRNWSITGTASGETSKNLTFYWAAADDNSYDWVSNSATPAVYFGATAYQPASVDDYDVSLDPRWVTVTYPFHTCAATGETVKIGRSGGATLPVELSAFNAHIYQNNVVKLQWQTQSETNVLGFGLYRALGNDLENALRLDMSIPATNTSQPKTYLYFDREISQPGRYYYWLESTDIDGITQLFGPVNVQFEGGDSPQINVPVIPGLKDSYPNPFNPSTTIRYGVDRDGIVEIKIYNYRGQVVRNLLNMEKAEGWHQVIWDGTGDRGQQLGSGLYFARMQMSGKEYLHKLLMLK